MREPPIEEITRKVVAAFHPRRVILFGSRARGDAGPESDTDLFVEMETSLPPYERRVAVDRLFGLRDWPMDVLVYTPAEVDRLKDAVGSLVYSVIREGKVLYEG